MTGRRGGAQAGLVAVPGALFQGSLALGSLVQGTLGEVRAGGSLPVHPLLVAGWAGLVSTALNLLPVGNIDGGRMTQVPHPPPGAAAALLPRCPPPPSCCCPPPPLAPPSPPRALALGTGSPATPGLVLR